MSPVSTAGTAHSRGLSISKFGGKQLDRTTNDVLEMILETSLKKAFRKTYLKRFAKNFDAGIS
jgi:hypothetical protein